MNIGNMLITSPWYEILLSISEEHDNMFDNIDNMQRAEASELIRLMTSSRAVCSREEHGTDKCQNISPILSTYWHCIMFKNNLAVLAFGLNRNRGLKSHNMILLFFFRDLTNAGGLRKGHYFVFTV